MIETDWERREKEVVATEYASYNAFTSGTVNYPIYTQSMTPVSSEDYFTSDITANRYEDADAYIYDDDILAYTVELKTRTVPPDKYPDFQVNTSKIDKLLKKGRPVILAELFPGYGTGYLWTVWSDEGLGKVWQYSAPVTRSNGSRQPVRKLMYSFPHALGQRFDFDKDRFWHDYNYWIAWYDSQKER